ncbi:HD-GYP domain-containing protein [Desulfotalea psychrophila]|uniref:HD-GYP domain-containing protein n=1 Tax=Desulfotalea psychrophila (strain LSv54 / DSM 12343) TaxID=177439 RepID=Q6ARD0_DESPS|nr:HD domain-containing phosphohydrolase [Desulfotalea psychrophila]CAG35094.1 conserved hypothetical protein [Desulfotalea psychrophila LSv54]
MKNNISRIFHTSKLRNIFLLCFAIAALPPAYNTFFLRPAFTKQLISTTEENAQRVVTHIGSSAFSAAEVFNKESLTTQTKQIAQKSQKDFQIEKITALSKSGEIFFSTLEGEIGKINHSPYFANIVAKGNIYSTIVKSQTITAEHDLPQRDMADMYIPLLQDGKFAGAVEVHYDITAAMSNLEKSLHRSSRIMYTISTFFLFFAVLMLLRMSKAVNQRLMTEKALLRSQHKLENRVSVQTREIEINKKVSMEAMAVLAEYHNKDTDGHLARIQRYVALLTSYLSKNSPYAKYFDKRPHYTDNIIRALLLHDIGEVAIPKTILEKPGKLTNAEYDLVKTHTVIAGEVLNRANVEFSEYFNRDSYLALAADIALYHHERWDGAGYPNGLRGAAIPLAARIVALADVYDALRSKRAYKEAYPHADSVAEIIREKGKQFDPYVTEAFLAMADSFHDISSKNSGASSTETEGKK